FFFSSRRRHTRSTRDWSSDVCSSDLERVRDDDECAAGGAMRGGVDHYGTPPHAGDRARLRVDRGDGRVGARPDDGPRRLGIAVFVEVGDPVRQRPVADEYRVEDRLDTQGCDPVLYTEVDTGG